MAVLPPDLCLTINLHSYCIIVVFVEYHLTHPTTTLLHLVHQHLILMSDILCCSSTSALYWFFSAHMRFKVEKRCVRYSLKWVTKYSTIFHRWTSYLVPSTRTSSWWVHQTFLHRISKRCLFITVLPKLGADLYFDLETVDHSLFMSPSSKRVDWIIIPDYLIIYTLAIPLSPCLNNCW